MPAATRSSWMNAWEADLTPSPAARRSEARASAHVRSTRYYTREATARVPQFEETSQQQVRPLPQMKVLTRQRPPWGAVMVALVFSVLLLGVVIIAPVLINSATTQMESDIGQMQSGQEQLAAETAALSAQISALSAPNRVAEQAGRLGLGPAQSVYYVQTATETAATEGDTTVADR
jgi:cell division protein FtsL